MCWRMGVSVWCGHGRARGTPLPQDVPAKKPLKGAVDLDKYDVVAAEGKLRASEFELRPRADAPSKRTFVFRADVEADKATWLTALGVDVPSKAGAPPPPAPQGSSSSGSGTPAAPPVPGAAPVVIEEEDEEDDD